MTTESTALQLAGGERGLQLRNFQDMMEFAKCLSISGMAPKGMDKAEALVVAIQFGAELGLTPMASVQNIASINGRPAIFGDSAKGLVDQSGLMEDYTEEEVGKWDEKTPPDDYGIKVTVKRKGRNAQSTTFTVGDAKRAGLWDKPGPWKQYPKRMLMFRARGFVLRDAFPDVLKGLKTVEEVRDEPIDVTPPDQIPEGRGLAATKDEPASKLFGTTNSDPVEGDVEDIGEPATKADTSAHPDGDGEAIANEEPPQKKKLTKGQMIRHLHDLAGENGLTDDHVLKFAKAKKGVPEEATGIHDASEKFLQAMIDRWPKVMEFFRDPEF